MTRHPSSDPAPSTHRAAPSDRLSVRENIAYALGDTASCIYFWTFNLFLVYYYVDLWGIPAATVATIMFAVRVIDAVTDPLMGVLADRTQTRWGKFRPYLLWAAVPFGICGYLLFANPPLEGGARALYAFVTYTVMMLAYTAINVPYSALLGVISPSHEARTVASSYRMAGSYLGGLLVTLLARPLARILGGEDLVQGFQFTMALFAVIAVLLFLVCFRYTRERVQPPPQQRPDLRADLRALGRNRPWLLLTAACVVSIGYIAMRASGAVFYFKYNLGDDGSAFLFGFFDRTSVFLTSGLLAMLAGAVVAGWLARRWDKRTLMRWMVLGSALASGGMFWVPPSDFALLTLLYVVSCILWGPVSAYLFSMFGDVADYGEHATGRRTTGLVYSASLFALKTGSVLAGGLAPLLLDAFGFVPNAVQSEATLVGIGLVFAIIPAVMGVAKALLLWLYPLNNEQLHAIEADLHHRRRLAGANA